MIMDRTTEKAIEYACDLTNGIRQKRSEVESGDCVRVLRTKGKSADPVVNDVHLVVSVAVHSKLAIEQDHTDEVSRKTRRKASRTSGPTAANWR
jgi:hypothetical protein